MKDWYYMIIYFFVLKSLLLQYKKDFLEKLMLHYYIYNLEGHIIIILYY